MSSRAIQVLPGKLIESGQFTFKILLTVFKDQKKGASSPLSDSTQTLRSLGHVYSYIAIMIEPAVVSTRPQNVGAWLVKSHFDLV